MPNNVLVIGGGAREHSICWKLRESSSVDRVFLSPGNGCEFTVKDFHIKTADDAIEFCKTHSVKMVVIGPEKEICEGWADRLQEHCLVFAPNQRCSQLESSKTFAKDFMVANRLPTADYRSFDKPAAAIKFIESLDWKQFVIKEDGLCAGKGVTIASGAEAAIAKIEEIFANNSTNNRVVVEECLFGYEVSAMCFTDGVIVRRMPLSQDHKKAYEGDYGPNTGGMGAVAPMVVAEPMDREISEILRTTVDALRRDGLYYRGVLYAGLMITESGPKLLEFNCRFGDPETEVLLRLLTSDLFELMKACCTGNLAKLNIEWSKKQAIGIVIATSGYPGKIVTGLEISNIPQDNDEVITFYAGTKRLDTGKLVNSGGRALCVTAVSHSPFIAKRLCLETIEQIRFDAKFIRQDIGDFKTYDICFSPLTYAASGVNVDEGNRFVESIKKCCASTLLPGMEQIGGFGAVVDLASAKFHAPQLVVGMDGVGTKIEVADRCGRFDGLGFDLVGMCANDVLCHAARPLAFLDYYVIGKLCGEKALEIVESITAACKEANCALIGGETAEMPGVYAPDQWDLAGCCIGCRESEWPQLPQMSRIKAGDILIGLESNGVHSNGFSLIRKLLDSSGYSLLDPCPWKNGRTLGEEFLKPTKIYVRALLELATVGKINSMAHITGGGITENLPRALPKHLCASIDCRTWRLHPEFNWMKQVGRISPEELLKTFNCGLGMILVVSPENVAQVESSLTHSHMKFNRIGVVEERGSGNLGRVKYDNVEDLFSCVQQNTVCDEQERVNVAILISGSGSNMAELIRQSRKRHSNYFVSVIISNKDGVRGIHLAREMGVQSVVVPSQGRTRKQFEAHLQKELSDYNVQLICLAGFMRLLTGDFLKHWNKRILNIHPSLLPSFKGAHAVKLALEAGVKVTGCTVHYVVEDMDAGEILAQETVIVDADDDQTSLHKKIQTKEHRLFPLITEQIAKQLLNRIQ